MGNRSSDSRELKTKAEVMAALGGIVAVCALTGAEYGAVENWKRLKTFPSRYFLVMAFALNGKGLRAPPELWGQATPAQRKRALETLIAEQKRRVSA